MMERFTPGVGVNMEIVVQVPQTVTSRASGIPLLLLNIYHPEAKYLASELDVLRVGSASVPELQSLLDAQGHGSFPPPTLPKA